MSGEFGIEIGKIDFNRIDDFIKPYGNISIYTGNKPSQDLTITSTSNETFHICGNNDWAYLVVDALSPLLQYASLVENKISNDLRKMDREKNSKPKVIGLGRNDFRALDILFRIRGSEDSLKEYRNIPVVRLEEDNAIEFLGTKEFDLPFK